MSQPYEWKLKIWCKLNNYCSKSWETILVIQYAHEHADHLWNMSVKEQLWFFFNKDSGWVILHYSANMRKLALHVFQNKQQFVKPQSTASNGFPKNSIWHIIYMWIIAPPIINCPNILINFLDLKLEW